MPTLEEIRTRFQADRFASELTGAVIREAEPGRAVCTLALRPEHMNANHTPMGGAVFTLADFAFAVAANCERLATVSLSSQIAYLSRPKGERLIAVANRVKEGRSTCYYTVDVTDELGTPVAQVTTTGFIKC